MTKISPFTPLFFAPSDDTTGIRNRYVQTFARTDRILLQMLSDKDANAPIVYLNDMLSGTSTVFPMLSYDLNTVDRIYYNTLQMLSVGYYSLTVDGVESECFRVIDDEEELKETVLMQYSMSDNRKREDGVFLINSMRYFFEFRVPGGFKDGEWKFAVDSEQFVTARSDRISMYARESTQKTLTVGGAQGCPIWFADHLNRLFCCDYVYINGVRYTRVEESVPEVTEVIEGSRSFIFKQLLQEVKTIEPDMQDYGLSLRTVTDTMGKHVRVTTSEADGHLRRINK